MERSHLTRFAWLSVGAALLTIALKAIAYYITGSVGLLSDALESVVNLVAAIMVLTTLTVAARPPSELHPFGYGKAEYFSSGVEGSLILVAALGITWSAIQRLLQPVPLEHVGVGLAITLAAAAVNFAVARVLLDADRKYGSITLEADARHLMTDVWTSLGVVAGVAAVAVTGWERLDPMVALIVAANIIWTGAKLVQRSMLALLDGALSASDQAAVKKVLDQSCDEHVQFHALRTRQAGARKFVSVHILVPGEWTVQRGHDLLEQIEEQIRAAVPGANMFTHLEPLEDPVSWQDVGLDRDDES
ncbi:MAG: cation transporter [Gammaproteobacteria bacterium]|nr:cation transporter [Gammaproteobacteria bacterium]